MFRDHKNLLLFVTALFMSGADLVFCEDKLNTASVAISPLPSSKDELTLPTDLPPLPSFTEKEVKYLIDSKNVALFHEVLIAPVASWIKSGVLVIRAVRNLADSWKLSPEWISNTRKNFGNFSVDEFGNLLAEGEDEAGLFSAGFPFGFAEDINNEQDPTRKAQKILWNIRYASASQPELLNEIEFAWIGNRSVSRKAYGLLFSRFFTAPFTLPTPKLASPADSKPPAQNTQESPDTTVEEAPTELRFTSAQDIISQDVFHLTAPPVVLGFSFLRWNFRGVTEDLGWIYSPVVGGARRIVSANFSDPLLGTSIAGEDLFNWREKVSRFGVKVLDEKIVFLPFANLSHFKFTSQSIAESTVTPPVTNQPAPALPVAAEPAPTPASPTVRGTLQRSDGSSSFVLWNYNTGIYPSAALWTPTSVYFVPRKVWIIELNPRDPFSISGRQILVVDQESMLPFYKIIYSPGGEYLRTIVSSWGLAETENQDQLAPFLVFTIGVYADPKHATILSSNIVRAIPNSPAFDKYRKLVDISTYSEKERAPTEATPATTTTDKTPAPVGDPTPKPTSPATPSEDQSTTGGAAQLRDEGGF